MSFYQQGPGAGNRWRALVEYPRYFFGNHSVDVLRLCGEALGRLGVEWPFPKAATISVARRSAVTRPDGFAGPKC